MKIIVSTVFALLLGFTVYAQEPSLVEPPPLAELPADQPESPAPEAATADAAQAEPQEQQNGNVEAAPTPQAEPQTEKAAAEETPAEETPAEEATSPSEDTAAVEAPQTFSDPEFALPPAPQSDSPAQIETAQVADVGFKPSFKYGGTIRSRLGFDLFNEADMVSKPPSGQIVKEGTEDVIDWRNSVNFWTQLSLVKHLDVRLEAYGEYFAVGKRNEDYPTIIFNGRDYKQDFVLDLRDAYLHFFYGPFDLRVGNQVVSWGTLTVTSPSDRVNPRNTQNYYWSEVSGSKEHVFAARAVASVWDFNFEAIWIPFYKGSNLDLYGSDFSLFRYGSAYNFTAYPIPEISYYIDRSMTEGANTFFFSTEKPGASILNSQAGLRISATKGGVDFGLSYLYAYEELPQMQADPMVRALLKAVQTGNENLTSSYVQQLMQRLEWGETPDSLFRSRFMRKHSIAAELGFSLWEFGIKGEAAFWPYRTFYTTDVEAVEHHTLVYAGGIDFIKFNQSVFDQIFISFELFGSTIFDVPDGEKLVFSTRRNLGLHTTLRFTFLNEKLELEGVTQINFNTKDYVVVPRIGYEVYDNLRLIAGVMILDAWAKEPAGYERYSDDTAVKESLFGSFSNNDQVFIMMKYDF